MNKQELASTIWKSANAMRSNIAANEYKDYILGFIFYRFLSEKALKFALAEGYDESTLKDISEDTPETVEYFQNRIGYFIAYENMFSTWLDMGSDFDISNVRVALSAFERNISPTHKKVFEGIFSTLAGGLSKLGESTASQTKAVKKLFRLIRKIPMDSRQGYDVLGFIYEYLLRQFAANAGKAGEFYTPHEAAQFMSEIIAEHLKNRSSVTIYDPTSGSGSLLINIGSSIAQNMPDTNCIKYYAQDFFDNTYSLTRMNLIMRDIIPENICVRKGDTLAMDWPYFDDTDPANSYKPLFVDAVVSNPPYSQHWDSANRDNDPRFADFGLAPATKADFAFLLHGLYHLKPDGIMTIVMPHGVLFRGSSKKDDPAHGDAEWQIRRQLIERNHIDAIIGLPSNMFFGTSIATIVMVLKKQRSTTDVLFVDASRGFEKVDTKNQLRAQDVKRIVDAVTRHQEIPFFSRLVSQAEIRENDWNLNIPRYVTGADETEHFDIKALMQGGIPDHEIDRWNDYWQVFAGLRQVLFGEISPRNERLAVENISETVKQYPAVLNFKAGFTTAFGDFKGYLKARLLPSPDAWQSLCIIGLERVFSNELFTRLGTLPLLDCYEAHQVLDNLWKGIEPDLWILREQGLEAARKVDPHYKEVESKDGEEIKEIQDGWVGRIFPFELVQRKYLASDLAELNGLRDELNQVEADLGSLLGELTEDEQKTLLNDNNDSFDTKKVTAELERVLMTVDTPETKVLTKYLELKKKKDKLDFVKAHSEIQWNQMETCKDGTYGVKTVRIAIRELRLNADFPDDSPEKRIVTAFMLQNSAKSLKSVIKEKEKALEVKTLKTIESLTEEQIYELLEAKWITPLVSQIAAIPDGLLLRWIAELTELSIKYKDTMLNIDAEIKDAEKQLRGLLGQLTGSDDDIEGIQTLLRLLEE
jgi:type I restriction enzyme M protein